MNKKITISRGKDMESSIGFFSEIENHPNAITEQWELQNDDGTKHVKSDELMVHLKNLYQAKLFIKELFGE